MNNWQQSLIRNYLRTYKRFAGWDGQMVVGYYYQFLHSNLREIEITEAVLEANRQLMRKLK